jgi:hypothetical protein
MLWVQVHRYRVTGAKCFSEPEHLKNGKCGGWWGTQHGGHPAKDLRPTRGDPDPQPGSTLWEQPQDQDQQAEGDHGEVCGTYTMTRGMLV